MGRAEDEIERHERHMTNLLSDLEKLIPFFETKTITDIYVYGQGNVYIIFVLPPSLIPGFLLRKLLSADRLKKFILLKTTLQKKG